MPLYKLQFQLYSAATFGRGDGVAGLVDQEVEYDASGLPFLRGRALKGLLAEECANILFALEVQGRSAGWDTVAQRLFGSPGSTDAEIGLLRVGDGRLPEPLLTAVKAAVAQKDLRAEEVLASLTAIRRQTSMNEEGAPEKGSLRSTRVILPGTVFEAALEFGEPPDERTLGLLAACVLAWRRAGTGRNRGRGRLQANLLESNGTEVIQRCFRVFAREVAA